jgi:hypothetical protein
MYHSNDNRLNYIQKRARMTETDEEKTRRFVRMREEEEKENKDEDKKE